MVSLRLGGDDGDAAKWGLHFDLTVPFARYVLENPASSPSRSAATRSRRRGAVSGLQEGRYREFTRRYRRRRRG